MPMTLCFNPAVIGKRRADLYTGSRYGDVACPHNYPKSHFVSVLNTTSGIECLPPLTSPVLDDEIAVEAMIHNGV